MAFKSEIHVAELAAIDTGHTEGDTYYILDNGMLTDIPCKPGDFVEWHNLKWRKLVGEHYALNSDLQHAIEVIGKPLVWIGDASVATLNGTIEGLDSGWTYTLTDSGTLTAGSVKVEAGDEVAWSATEEKWVKIGGDTSPVAVVTDNEHGPTSDETIAQIVAAAAAGKIIIIKINNAARYIMTGTVSVPMIDGGTYTTYSFLDLKKPGRYRQLNTYSSTGLATWSLEYDDSVIIEPDNVIAEPWDLNHGYDIGDIVMYHGRRWKCIADVSGDDTFVSPGHWQVVTIEEDRAKINSYGVFIGGRQIHPGTKLFIEGLPVDNLDYELIKKFNAMIYNRVTALAVNGSVTLGLWNYDTKAYVSETVLSTDAAHPTVIDISEANASDTMEIHLKGSGTVDNITGSIIV